MFVVTLDQPNPVRGATVTFTGTFPQAAFKQARNPQYPINPFFEVVGTVQAPNDFMVAQEMNKSTKVKLPDGSIQVTSFPVLLASPSWPVGAGATASITTGYWTQDHGGNAVFNFVASSEFTVSP